MKKVNYMFLPFVINDHLMDNQFRENDATVSVKAKKIFFEKKS